ncbi:hypothetical protein DDK21_01290 [Achromobacter xylosoxidans]|nr:hypothetical protein AL490_006240 [Achromobacter xylosoxidans]PWV43481.1 hypothetical protein DDK21_01290 [Achromobacter xylosoxidans]
MEIRFAAGRIQQLQDMRAAQDGGVQRQPALGAGRAQQVGMRPQRVVDVLAQGHQRMARRHIAGQLDLADPGFVRHHPDPRGSVAGHRYGLLPGAIEHLGQLAIQFEHAYVDGRRHNALPGPDGPMSGWPRCVWRGLYP